jgi:hypothetical protein
MKVKLFCSKSINTDAPTDNSNFNLLKARKDAAIQSFN